MLVYAFGCLFSSVLFYLSSNVKYGKKQFINIILLIISMCIPCAIAGCRDLSIGTDVKIYANDMFISALHTDSIFNYMKMSYKSVEPLFKMLVYILSLTKSRFIYYFGLELACVFPIFIRAYKFKFRYSWISIYLYFVWLFGFSLNIMRQSIAIAIIFWGCKYVYERNIKKYFIVVIFSMGFHLTGAVGIIIYFIYAMFSYDTNKLKNGQFNRFVKKYNKILKPIFLIILILIVTNSSILITNISRFFNRYHAEVYDMSETNDVGLGYGIIIAVALAIAYYVTYVTKQHNEQKNKGTLFIIICGIILFYMSKISGQLYRISLFFTSYNLIYFSLSFEKIKQKSICKLLMVLIVLVFIYFIYHFYIKIGWNSVYPYKVYLN